MGARPPSAGLQAGMLWRGGTQPLRWRIYRGGGARGRWASASSGLQDGGRRRHFRTESPSDKEESEGREMKREKVNAEKKKLKKKEKEL